MPVEEVMPNPTTKTAIYQLKNLSPFSNMQLQICVMNTFYVGPPSDPIAFNTVEGGGSLFSLLQFVVRLRLNWLRSPVAVCLILVLEW